MIQLRSLAKFVRMYTFSFTSGLALSSGLDVLITSLLCFLLYKNRKDQPSTNHILDKLTLYTFENGLLTWYFARNPVPPFANAVTPLVLSPLHPLSAFVLFFKVFYFILHLMSLFSG
jgi:hypothetical protein